MARIFCFSLILLPILFDLTLQERFGFPSELLHVSDEAGHMQSRMKVIAPEYLGQFVQESVGRAKRDTKSVSDDKIPKSTVNNAKSVEPSNEKTLANATNSQTSEINVKNNATSQTTNNITTMVRSAILYYIFHLLFSLFFSLGDCFRFFFWRFYLWIV